MTSNQSTQAPGFRHGDSALFLLNKNEFLSEEKFAALEKEYDENVDGYGTFFKEYYDSSDNSWEFL